MSLDWAGDCRATDWKMLHDATLSKLESSEISACTQKNVFTWMQKLSAHDPVERLREEEGNHSKSTSMNILHWPIDVDRQCFVLNISPKKGAHSNLVFARRVTVHLTETSPGDSGLQGLNESGGNRLFKCVCVFICSLRKQGISKFPISVRTSLAYKEKLLFTA